MHPLRQERFDPFGKRVDDLVAAGSPGMTLRDYFAAKALPVAMQVWYANDKDAWETDENKVRLATAAYKFADAMLKARQS